MENHKTEGPTGLIYQRMAAALPDVEAVSKSRKNAEQKYAYRGAEDIMNAIHPVLAKHKIFIVQDWEEMIQKDGESSKGSKFTETTMKMVFNFTTDDGSSIAVRVPSQGRDYGDMGVYKCMTMAFKYALAFTFCVPFAQLDGAEDKAPIEAKVDENKGPAPIPEVTEAMIQEAILQAKAQKSLIPLVTLWNMMPANQQEDKKDLLAETRKEIEELRGPKQPLHPDNTLQPPAPEPIDEEPQLFSQEPAEEKKEILDIPKGLQPRKSGAAKPKIEKPKL